MGAAPFIAVECLTAAPIGRDFVLVRLRGRASRVTERPPQLAVHGATIDYLVDPLATSAGRATGAWEAGYVVPASALGPERRFQLNVDGVREDLPAPADERVSAADGVVASVPRAPLVDTLAALGSIVLAERATLTRIRSEIRTRANHAQLDRALDDHAHAVADASARGGALKEALAEHRGHWDAAFANAVDHQRKLLRLGEQARREASELASASVELARATQRLECSQGDRDEEDARAKQIRLAGFFARNAARWHTLGDVLTGRTDHAMDDSRRTAQLDDWTSKSREWRLQAHDAVRGAERKVDAGRSRASAATCDLLTTLTRCERARVRSRVASATAHEELLALEQRVAYERLEVDAALERIRATRHALEAAQIALELSGAHPDRESAMPRGRRFARNPRRVRATAT